MTDDEIRDAAERLANRIGPIYGGVEEIEDGMREVLGLPPKNGTGFRITLDNSVPEGEALLRYTDREGKRQYKRITGL